MIRKMFKFLTVGMIKYGLGAAFFGKVKETLLALKHQLPEDIAQTIVDQKQFANGKKNYVGVFAIFTGVLAGLMVTLAISSLITATTGTGVAFSIMLIFFSSPFALMSYLFVQLTWRQGFTPQQARLIVSYVQTVLKHAPILKDDIKNAAQVKRAALEYKSENERLR